MHQLSCNPHLQKSNMISQFSDNGPRAKETSDKIKPQFFFFLGPSPFPFITFHFFNNILCPKKSHTVVYWLKVAIVATNKNSTYASKSKLINEFFIYIIVVLLYLHKHFAHKKQELVKLRQ